MYFHVNRFAPTIKQGDLLGERFGALLGPQVIQLESYGKTNEQDTTFRYITLVLFCMLYDANGNRSLYLLGTNASELKKFQVPENDEFLPTMLETLPCTIIREIGMMRLEGAGRVVID